MARYCGSCGTEVDETAAFCPTCGSPIEEGEASDLPPAPGWPDPAESVEPPAPAVPSSPGTVDRDPWAAERESEREPEPWREPEHAPADAAYRRDETRAPVDDDDVDEPYEAPAAVEAAPTRVEPRPATGEPEWTAADERPAPRATERRDGEATSSGAGSGSGGGIDLPLTMPVTLSGWLIGAGSAMAALGIVVILLTSRINVIDLLLLLALLGIAATVFASAKLPAIPQLRLITLVVVLIAFGVALDRLGFRVSGVGELLLFLGSAAAAIGAILVELGQDQPLGPQR